MRASLVRVGSKPERFIAEYLIDMNATQAAIRAGYSPKSAHVQGSRLLKNAVIADAIAEGLERLASKLEVTAERVLQERARLAFYNPMRLAGVQTIEQLRALDEDTQRAIQAIDVSPTGELRIRGADKDKSLTALEKHLGMYRDNERASGVLNIQINL